MNVFEDDIVEVGLNPHAKALLDLAERMRNGAKMINKHVAANESGELRDLLVYFYQLKEAYADLDAARKEIYAEVDRINKAVLPKKFERLGTDIFRIPEMKRSFHVRTEYSAGMRDKEKGFEWLRDRGDEDLIQETVNAGTLKAYLKNVIEEEGIDPPDFFKFSSYETIGSSKTK